MNNFDLKNPTKILFGKGRIANLNDQIPADAKVLVLFGGGSAEST
jgi:NADP-dependent alcohol dehydrogenase